MKNQMKPISLRFNVRYAILTVLLFVVEVLIALYVHDAFVRPYLGDVLVVILIYCFIQSFFNLPVIPATLGVLLFAFGIEVAQYFQMVHLLGLEHSRLMRIVLGSSFEWADMLAYTAGALLVIGLEKITTRFAQRPMPL